MTEPTIIQQVTLQLIQAYYLQYMYPPTVRELAQLAGVSVKAMQDRIQAMRKKGMFQSPTKLVPNGIKITRQ